MPPQAICDAYKKYQRMDDAAVDADLEIVDFKRGLTETQKEKLVPVDTVPSVLIDSARKAFKYYGQAESDEVSRSGTMPDACTVYEHKDFDGLRKPHGIISISNSLNRSEIISISPSTRMSGPSCGPAVPSRTLQPAPQD